VGVPAVNGVPLVRAWRARSLIRAGSPVLDPGYLADRRDARSPVRGRAEIAPVGDYFPRVKIQD
jgi:hypothetical protein